MLLKKKDIVNFFCVILISCTSFLGAFVPISIGFIEARENIKQKKLFFYAVSLIVVMLKFNLEVGVFYAINVLLVLVFMEVLEAFFIKDKVSIGNVILLVTLCSNILCESFDGLLAYDVVIAILAGLSAMISYSLFKNLNFDMYEIDEKGFLILSVIMGILVVTLKDFTIYSFALTNILAIYIILNLAYFKGIKFAVVGGAIIGMIGEISKTSMGTFIISLTLGGLFAAILGKKGKLMAMTGFMLGNSLIAYYITGYNTLVTKYVEILIAGLMFFITNRKMEHISKFIMDDVLLLSDGVKGKIVEDNTLETTSNTLYNISDVIDDFNYCNEEQDIISEIKNNVCSVCDKYNSCWDKNSDKILSGIYDYVSQMEVADEVGTLDIDCDNKQKVLSAIDDRYSNYKNEKSGITFNDLKKSMASQIKGISKYIYNIAAGNKEEAYSIEERIVKGFEKINVPITKAYVNMNEDECEVELKANRNVLKSNLEKSNVVLSEILNKRMVNTDRIGNFKETKKLKVVTAVKSECATGQKISGDTYKLIDFLTDKYIMVLSDGMGVGADAKYISNILVDMFSNMSKNNIDTETITTLISSFAQYISKSEKIITLDSTSINLVTGECELIKIGGSPTFIIKKDSVDIICSETLPLGIFEEIDFYKETRFLVPGDIIVSVSDGVIDSKRDIINKEFWVSSFLKRLDIDEPTVIAEELLNKTIENYNGKIADDITIIVQKVV
ncbi:MAG: SpoIIE family protein phosphatase [Clostridia bacterium]|nr:SpoIIE family protein phosphatase [Clostridia bacterium]